MTPATPGAPSVEKIAQALAAGLGYPPDLYRGQARTVLALFRNVIRTPEEAAVIAAARSVVTAFEDRVRHWSELSDLRDAVRALDAAQRPSARARFEAVLRGPGWCVLDHVSDLGYPIRIAECGQQTDAERIAAALNAAERNR